MSNRVKVSILDIVFYMAIISAIIFVFASCDCNYHLNKAKSKCGYKLSTDTIFRVDTLITTEYSRDSLFYFNQKDTVVLREGKLIMKYFYHDSLVYLDGKCLSDTIIKEVPVYVNKTEIEKPFFTTRNLLIISLFFVMAVLGSVIIKHIFSR